MWRKISAIRWSYLLCFTHTFKFSTQTICNILTFLQQAAANLRATGFTSSSSANSVKKPAAAARKMLRVGGRQTHMIFPPPQISSTIRRLVILSTVDTLLLSAVSSRHYLPLSISIKYYHPTTSVCILFNYRYITARPFPQWFILDP